MNPQQGQDFIIDSGQSLEKNIIITGAAGYLGSYFCEFLAKNNYNVIGLDNDQKKVKSLNRKFKKK